MSYISPLQLRVMTLSLLLTMLCTAVIFGCWGGAAVAFGLGAAMLETLAQVGGHRGFGRRP
jgi:hypothetical protein